MQPIVLIAAFVVCSVLLVLVFAIMRWRRATINESAPPASPAVHGLSHAASLPSNIEAEVQMLLDQGKKIDAIKLVREHTQLGLKEAKEYVEALSAGATFSYTQPEMQASQTSNLAVVQAEVRALLARGKKIDAIKLVREHTHWGLKEAKEYVEGLEVGAPSPASFEMPEANQSVLSSLDMEAEARSLLAQGRKIEAVKLVRQHTGWGLKEAKDYVDQLVETF